MPLVELTDDNVKGILALARMHRDDIVRQRATHPHTSLAIEVQIQEMDSIIAACLPHLKGDNDAPVRSLEPPTFPRRVR